MTPMGSIRQGHPPTVTIAPLRLLPDDRGSFLKVLMRHQLPAPATFGEIYVTTAQRGAMKGRHFHERTTEWFCLLRGRSRLWLQELRPAPGPRYVLDLAADAPCLVVVPPQIAHGFENPDSEPMVLLAYADCPYDPADTDTIPYALGEGVAP